MQECEWVGYFSGRCPNHNKECDVEDSGISATEIETIASVQCMQGMLYCKRVFECMDLKVELPMELHIDNNRAVDLANNQSAEGKIRHMENRVFFLSYLKETEIIETKWKKGT
eukprot:4229169-Ditylum_brightwellii.AAC.1